MKSKDTIFRKVCDSPQLVKKGSKLDELVRVYHDLERTLLDLRHTVEKNAESSLKNINVRKLMVQLSRSKRRLERKIGNTLLLEKQHLKKRLRAFASNLSHRENES